jgi:hypothetical protein
VTYVRVLAAVVVIAVAGGGVVAPSAAATWHEQRLASGSAASAVGGPALASNPRGDTAVAWSAGRRAYLAVRRARAARFGRRIALPAFSDPLVAVLSDGTVLVATSRNDGTTGGRRPCCAAIYVQRLRPGARRLSTPRVITVPGVGVGSFGSELVTGPDGRAALIASADEVSLVTSRRSGVFRAPAWPSEGRFGNPSVAAFGGDGRGVALWIEGSNHEQRLRGAPIRADGTVGPPRTYVDTPQPSSDFSFFTLDAGIDRRGTLTAAWEDSGDVALTPGGISVATGGTEGSLGPRQVLDSPPGIGGGVSSPDLSVAPDGRALVTWRRYSRGGEQVGLAVRNRAGEPFRILPLTPGDAYGARSALLSGGHGLLVSGRAGTTSARPVSPRGALGAARALRGATAPTGVSVVAGAGRFTIAWGTATGLRVATSRPG